MNDYVIIMTILTTGFVGLFGGSGAWLIVLGWPRFRGYPACGACAADVTGAVAAGICPRCRRWFAQTGVEPPRRKWRPILLALGLMLSVVALGILGFVILAYWL